MKHSVHGQANSPPRDTAPGPVPVPAAARGLVRRLTAGAVSGTLTAMAVGVPTAALMCVGYHLGGPATMWGTFIGAFYPLTQTVTAWRNRDRP
jgi:hypothetical protein